MPPKKKPTNLTVSEVQDMLSLPKHAENPFSWTESPGYDPSWWKWQSALLVNGVVPEGLFACVQWQSQKADDLPKLYCSVVWRGQRIFGIDMATQCHGNPVLDGASFSGAWMRDDVHKHIWTQRYSAEYVEPVAVAPVESDVFSFFLQESKMTIDGLFFLPDPQKHLFF